MPTPIRDRRLDAARDYILRDEFDGQRAAGGVNNTAAEPVVDRATLRVVVDTDSDGLSINGGLLRFANPNGVFGDPGYWLDAMTRIAGQLIVTQITFAATNTIFQAGWDTNQASALNQGNGFHFGATANLHTYNNNVFDPQIATYAATSYQLCVVLRSSGAYYLIKGGAFTNWTLLWVSGAGSVTPLYPTLTTQTAVPTSDYLRLPRELWLPTPAAYDTFTRANGALGDSETNGPDSQSTPARAWQSGGSTWAIASNEAVNTPTEGSDVIVNGNFANWTGDDPDDWALLVAEDANNYVTENPAGQCQLISDGTNFGIRQQTATTDIWYLISLNITAWAAGSLQVYGYGDTPAYAAYGSAGTKTLVVRAADNGFLFKRGGATNVTFDDVSIKPLTLNTLFSNVETSTANVVAQVECDTVVTRTQAGLVLNLDDKDTPANFVIAYHDGTNAKLDKCVAGTYTSVISAAAAYAAGANLVVVKSGTSYSLYYNNAQVGATQTISDAGIISNTLHGLFSTYSGNQLDNFQVFPRGTNNEYQKLSDY